jgi:hypothetical protein
MCVLAFPRSSFCSLLLLRIASDVVTVESFDTDEFSCTANGVEYDSMLCQSVASHGASVNVPSLLQKVQGAPRVQVAAPQDYADDGNVDDGNVEVRIVLPKHGHHMREPGSHSKPEVVAMVEVLEDDDSNVVPPKVVELVQNTTPSDSRIDAHKTVSSAANSIVVNLTESNGEEVPTTVSQKVTSSVPKLESDHKKQESSGNTITHIALHGAAGHTGDALAATSETKISKVSQMSSAGPSTQQAMDFLQENSTNKLEDENIDHSSHHAHANHHHRHGRHLLLPNSTNRHQIALAIRHLLEGYLDSAKKHPLLSPLLASRLKPQKGNRLDHGVAEHASMPHASKLGQPLYEDDDTAMSTFYLAFIVMSSCLFLGMLCLSCWPAAGERLDMTLKIGPALLVGKRATDFTMTLLDGSTKRLRDITQEGKPIVVKFYNHDDNGKSLLRQSKFSQDVKGFELMARDVKYAGHVNFVLVNLQGRGAAVEYHNSLKLSGAFQPTFAGAAILHGGLNGAWCDLSQDYHTSYCPHTTVIDSQGIVVRNYNHVRWWTEGSVVGEDFAALSQTVDDLMKVSANPGVVM